MSSFEKVVKNACKPKAAPPKGKYLDPIIAATWSDDGAIHDVCKALSPRFREPNSIVVFKALIVLHVMIRNGSTDNVLQYLSSSEVLRLKNVGGGQWEGYDAPKTLQNYALYLDARIRAYRDLKHDAIRVQSETNRDLRLSMSLEEDTRRGNKSSSEGETNKFQPPGGAARRKTIMGRKLRIMTVEKGLLRETKVVQKLLDALVECRFYLDNLEDELTITSLQMLVKDLLILFQAVNEGVINVLEHYFEMSHVDAEQALAIYRHFCKQAEHAVEFLGVARKLQNLLNVPIPNLKHAPVSLVGALEEYLNDPNFEQNRIEYKANRDAADKSLKNGRSVAKKADQVPSTSTAPATEAPGGSSSKETPKAETTKALTDFFETIDNQQTTIFNPQSASPTSGQFQQATYNPFNAASASTNPFPLAQVQAQPTGFLQPQFTVVPGAIQQPANPFPALQATSAGFLQPQMTGANPFRATTTPQQATGLSPFGPSNPLQPAPTGANPFFTQSGLPGTNPFPMMNSTNPFPVGAQTTNPFPAAANVNPFAGLNNSSFPNAAAPSPFPSSNSNPFPIQSRSVSQPFPLASSSQPPATNLPTANAPMPTSMFNAPAPIFSIPARPASTPLTQRKPSSPPPQPLKPHQTGSRNPFGVPKAPSPPPVPRPPTLFELASGVAQPQLQPQQSQAQVKPQATGLPTTAFSSVASSFITGGPVGVQTPQLTTPSLTSNTTTTAIPITATTTATGSTFSDSIFSSLNGQPTGNTAMSSQPTGMPPLRPQTTGFSAGIKTFKPTSSFGASLLETLPPIPQSAPTTPTLEPASSPAASATTVPTGVGLADWVSHQRLGSSGGGGSTIGVGLRPQATGAGVGTVNPFRASVFATPGAGGASSMGALPPFSVPNVNAASPFAQSLFVGGQTNGSKQPMANGTAATSLI
ncbi:ANTH domain-containing protein [Lactifluus volemus]|nr:ANTH domain-containing protein [Lactifluus volemus]